MYSRNSVDERVAAPRITFVMRLLEKANRTKSPVGEYHVVMQCIISFSRGL